MNYPYNLHSKVSVDIYKKSSIRDCMSLSKPPKIQLKPFNWDIANDTYIPLPTSENDADWFSSYLSWLDYCYHDKFSLSILGEGGHC